ncbi:Glycerate kinase [Vibrio aerogenes CECT 7868]|uniref:Glycerate kinase n=1 Tax=Vibrio aerogenes CECT 7868 TaxID=1216006 RepID=A0A1M5ZDZ6_9VIBR|nr:glycerate kinase [Vibrio aerogenes]SHI22450.1 Glycerate kinase [Vibrio aerogenes CECT 7868]
MKVVIAPDSFKESLSAQQVCEAIRTGMVRVWPEAEFVCIPVADGGEGTVQALVDATQGQIVHTRVTSPLGEQTDAFYGLLGDQQTAVVEMAQASGLHLVPREQRDPKRTTSYGTGQLILHALDHDASRFIIGLGGSATNDGGAGMLSALGARFFSDDKEIFRPSGQDLATLTHIDISGFDPRLRHCDIQVACDVDNPLCGEYGATAIYGPQKGATEADIDWLERGLLQFGRLTEQLTGKPVINQPGAGAAGGMGAALLAYTPAILKPGTGIITTTVRLSEHLADADLVVTGEGRIDHQTIHGKTPVGVASIAKQYHLPVIALAGCTGKNYQAVYQHGIDAVFTIVPGPVSLSQALTTAAANLTDTAENIARMWQLSAPRES